MKYILLTLVLLNPWTSIRAGGSGSGPPGNITKCFQDSTLSFNSSSPREDLTISPWIYQSEEFFKPSTSPYDTRDLVGFVEPAVFDALKYNSLINQEDVWVSIKAEAKKLAASTVTKKVTYLNYFENPDEIELVFDNNSSIHIAPMPENDWSVFIKELQKTAEKAGGTSSLGCPSASDLVDYYSNYFGQK